MPSTGWSYLARVGLQERRVAVRVQLVIDREVAEIERRVAHSGVLPVDDPKPVSIVDEVGVQQVVVAGPKLHRRGQAGQLDPARDRPGEVVLRRDRDAA